VPYYAEKSDSKKAKYGGKLSKNHNLPTSRTMQDALQQVVREKDAAFREKDTQNSFSETPLEAKCGSSAASMMTHVVDSRREQIPQTRPFPKPM
jgi:hypothetical protein